jgi:hypothetical protein
MVLPVISLRPIARRRCQRGNGLVFALLGLLISALGTAGVMQAGRLQVKHDAGMGEATILENLRNATNNVIFDSLGQIQDGAAIVRESVSVLPVDVNGQLVWQPTIAQLVAMGYLPPGWSAKVSSLNEAPYLISFRRMPDGCAGPSCGVEGHVILGGPILSGPGRSDGAIIGPLLAHIGADAGVSLPMDPSQIEGFGNTWRLDNPVSGQPSGVVALRVGTASAFFGQFVRVGDTRDPDLSGNLTVAGNTVFGNGTTHSEFKSALQLDAQPIELRDTSGTPCVTIRPEGSIAILCNGTLDASTGSFKDANGNSSVIAGSGLVTSGRVDASGGLATAALVVSASDDPNAILVNAGDLFVKSRSGTALLRVAANGDATAGNDVIATGALQGQRLTLTSSVGEGDACSSGQVALLSSGGLATCQKFKFRATSRYASLGDACEAAGLQATDSASEDALVCRGSHYASLSGLMSSRVYMAGFSVRNGDYIPVATALPAGCPATAGPITPEATIYLLPQSDAATPGNGVLNRNAQWTGSGWTISLTDGAGGGTSSLVVAEVYCLYP